MVELFKDPDSQLMAVRTDAETPEQFFQQLAHGLGAMIENGTYDGDWALQLSKWLPQAFEIGLKLRGYKADVLEKRLITAGDFAPSLPPVVTTDERLKPLISVPVINGPATFVAE